MPPPLAELTARAQTLTSAGDLVGARNVLAPALDPSDADPQHASADLATAAALHARILVALGDPHGARMWAGFAHAAQDRLHGPHDERTVAAAATHAAVLTRVGNHGRAAQLYHDLVGVLTTLDGPESPRVLAADADLATAEHAAGHCTAARARLADAWARYRRVYGDATPGGIKMLARLGAMERECGRISDSRHYLAQAQDLCARHLSAGHPLVRQVSALSGAPATGRHTCGRVLRSVGPHEATGVTAVGPAPGARAPGAQPRIHRPGPPAQSPPALAGRPASPPAPDPPGRTPPDAPQPGDHTTGPYAEPHQQPLYRSQAHQADELTGRHARADTPVPAPGQHRPGYTPDGRRVPVRNAAAGADDRLLPMPVRRPERAGSARQPFVLAAVLVAGIGVAAAVVAAMLPRGDATPAQPPPPPSPAATSAAPATPASAAPPDAGAPAGVRLQDNRDGVTLSWTYPKDSEGPVLISGGRAGEPQKAFQQLPAGSGDYVVYGLNEQLDYCFTVSVVYSTERVAASVPVCTARR